MYILKIKMTGGKSFTISSVDFIEDDNNELEFIGADKLLNNKFSNFIELKNKIESISLVSIEITDIVTTRNFKYILFSSGRIDRDKLFDFISSHPEYRSRYRYYNIYRLSKIFTIIDSPIAVNIDKPLFRFQDTESVSSIIRKLEIEQSLLIDSIKIYKNDAVGIYFNGSGCTKYLQDKNSLKKLAKDFIKYIELGIQYGDNIYGTRDRYNDLVYILTEYHKIYPDIISDKTIYIDSKKRDMERLTQIIRKDGVSYIFNGESIGRSQITTSNEINKMIGNLKLRLSNL